MTLNLSQKQKKKEQNLKSKEKLGQAIVSCQVIYGFIKVNTENEEFWNEIMLEVSKSIQVQNRPPTAIKKVTPKMEEDVKLFSKKFKNH